MQRSDRRPLRMLPVSQVVSRIVGNPNGLSQVVSPSAGACAGPSSSLSSRPSSNGTGVATTNDKLHSYFRVYMAYREQDINHTAGLAPTQSLATYCNHQKNFLKQVILVDVGVTSVPSWQAWQDLHDKGCIADVLEINGAWTEQEVFDALDGAFSKVLDQGHPPPRYSY